MEKQIQALSENLIHLIDTEATVSVEKKDEYYYIQINIEPTGIFIGFHGETLSSLQIVLSAIIKKQLGPDLKIVLNVGDYNKQREEKLIIMAQKALESVVKNQKSYQLPNLNARERKFIHTYLSDFPEVKTESVGEGLQRRLVVFPESSF